MSSSTSNRLLALVHDAGILRARDAVHAGIARTYIQKAVERGEIERVGRGVYTLAGQVTSEHQTLLEVTRRVPHAVICLLSALRLHEMTTANPHEVWIMIDRKARKPTFTVPQVRVVRCARELLNEGVEDMRIDSLTMRVTNPARTVADCFRYRNKIGLEVAIDALRDCIRKKRCTMDDLWKYAKVRLVANIMRPYMEALA
jgi:predicted transcriptional regulator of viral defense system